MNKQQLAVKNYLMKVYRVDSRINSKMGTDCNRNELWAR